MTMNRITKVNQIGSMIQSKHKKGGQSQNRYQRLRVEAIGEYVSRVVDAVNMIGCHHIVFIGKSDKRDLVAASFPTATTLPEFESVHELVSSGYTPPNMEISRILNEAKCHLDRGDGWIEYGTKKVEELIIEGQLEWIIAPTTWIKPCEKYD